MAAIPSSVRSAAARAGAVAALAVFALSLVIDLTPRFHLGDSATFIFTRLGAFIPDNRSWLYGLTLGWVERTTGALASVAFVQTTASWAAFAAFAAAARTSLGLRRGWSAAILLACALEPLTYFWSRSFMADSAAQSAFVLLCAVLLTPTGAIARFVLVLAAGFVLIALRVLYFPAVLLGLVAATAWQAWLCRGLGWRGVMTNMDFRRWAVSVLAVAAANFAYAGANMEMTTARTFSTNVGGMAFVVAALSPLMGDELDATPLTPAERAALVPLTYDNRQNATFDPDGLAPLIRHHFASAEAARPAMARLVALTALRHPVGVVGLTLRQWVDYLNPVFVLHSQRAGWWSGAAAHGQGVILPEAIIHIFQDWKVWPIPDPDLPSRPSPALWWFKHGGGVTSLTLALYATCAAPGILLVPRRQRTPFVVFAGCFSFVYMGFIALAANDVVTRYLLPLSAPLIYTIAAAVRGRLDARSV